MPERFEVGQKVLVGGSEIATITYINYDDNRVHYTTTAGGMPTRNEGWISHTRIESLNPIQLADLEAAHPDVANVVPNLSADHNGADVQDKPKNDPNHEDVLAMLRKDDAQ